jgi:hypothetical protein
VDKKSYNGSDLSCGDASDGELTVTATGGSGTLMYSLNDTTYQSSNVFSGLVAGTYSVRVKDANGCVVTLSEVTISAPALITGTVSKKSYNGSDLSCGDASDGELTVTATGGSGTLMYSLNDTTYQSSNVFSGLSAGTYHVTVRDTNNCVVTLDSITISAPALITGTAVVTSNYNGSQLSCNDANDGELSVSASGGSGFYNYSLDGTTYQSSNVFSGLVAGTYSVRVKDANGCVVTLSEVTISAPALITGTVDKKSYSGSDLSCGDASDGELMVIASGGSGFYNYSLDGTTYQSSNVFSGLSAGTYSVRVKDANGCVVTLSPVTITAPAIITMSNNFENFGPLCNDESINVLFTSNAPNVTFAWTNSNTNIGLAASGTGDINFVTNNITNLAQSAWIKVTPQILGCLGVADSFQIVVACPEISGNVQWHRTGTGLPGVAIAMSGDKDDSEITNPTGMYDFQEYPGLNFNLTPDSNYGTLLYDQANLALYGIDTTDLNLISRFVNGETQLLSGFDLIAADLNDNGAVTSADATILRFALQGFTTALDFLNNQPWIFVNAQQSLNPADPWNYTDMISITNLNGEVKNQNWLAVRRGDVIGINGILDYSQSSGRRLTRNVVQLGPSPEVTLAVKPATITADCGDQITFDIILESLSSGDSINLFTLDAGIIWDPTMMSFADTIRKNLNYGTARITAAAQAGEVLYSWSEQDFAGGFFKPGDTLISVKLNVISAPSMASVTLGRTSSTAPPGVTAYLVGASHTDVFEEKVPVIQSSSITLNPSYTINAITENNAIVCSSQTSFNITPVIATAPESPDKYLIIFNQNSINAGFSDTVTGSWNGTSSISITLPEDLQSGTYGFTLQVGKGNCYSNPQNVGFSIESPINVSISGIDESFCSGTSQTGTLNVTPAGDYTYAWSIKDTTLSSSSSTFTFNILKPGSYEVTGKVTSPGCGEKLITQTILINAIPEVTYPAANDQITLCNDQEIAVSFQSSVPGTSFAWTATALPGAVSTQIPASGSGALKFEANYVDSALITVTPTANSCSGDPVSFKIIVAAGSSDSIDFSMDEDSLCVNASPIVLSASPSGAQFAGPGVIGTSFDPGTAGAGKHFITYSVSNSGCTASKIDSIVVLAQPTANLTVADTLVCYNGSTSFNIVGTPGAKAWYSLDGQSAHLIIPQDGDTSVTINSIISSRSVKLDSVNLETSLSCTRVISGNTINIQPRQQLDLASISLDKSVNCAGDQIKVNLSGTANSRIFYKLSGGTSLFANLNELGVGEILISGITDSTTVYVDSIGYRNTPVCAVPLTNISLPIQVSKAPSVGPITLVSVCSDAELNINLRSYITNLSSVTPSFTWEAAAVNGVVGITVGSGDTLKQHLISTSGEVVTVNYAIKAENASATECLETVFTIPVRILPTAKTKLTVGNDMVCPGEELHIAISDSFGLQSIMTYTWSRNVLTGVSGLESGTGEAIRGILNRDSLLEGNLTFTITATPSNGCQAEIVTTSIELLNYQQCTEFDCEELDNIVNLIDNQITNDTTISAGESITSSISITQGNRVTFIASNSITLLPGFEVNKESFFTAKILNCSPLVIPSAPELSLQLETFANLPQETDFNIFPNPVNDVLNIELFNADAGKGKLTLFDFKGSFVKHIIENEHLPKGPIKMQTDLNQIVPGIYFIVYTNSSGSISKKLVISR